MLYRERKVSFHISTKTHLLEFSTFSWLPSTHLSHMVAFKHAGHWVCKIMIHVRGSKADEMYSSQRAIARLPVNNLSVCYTKKIRSINESDFHKEQLTESVSWAISLLLWLNDNHPKPWLKIRWSSKYFAFAYSLLYSTRLDYLAGQNRVNIAMSDRMGSFLSLFIHSLHARH